MNTKTEAPKTPAEASAAGFIIDHFCYPWFAYKGPRFQPDEGHQILTEKEADLLAALKEAARAIMEEVHAAESNDEDDHPVLAAHRAVARRCFAAIAKAERLLVAQSDAAIWKAERSADWQREQARRDEAGGA